ncbi:hypothetical protein Prudu_012472 [Prunus dulcis]|uniref:RNase III domain-containing protein n=1 Tax=Prunus dulcis TaxID=3755 RepID=A0A4Y1RCS3_PRUDU|nr:hypothetical protein Prudu_012472 [Prunus dulcis]
MSFTSTQHACTIKVQIKPRPGRIHQRDKMRLFTHQLQPSPEMKERVTAVERIVGYDFEDKTLLEEALTHPLLSAQFVSTPGAPGRQRSQPRSDKFNEEEITNRLKDTVSNPYLARIGARLGLYDYLVRHNTPDLDDQVAKFTEGVIKGKDMTGSPGYKVLADVVESVAAAVYIDLNYDLDKLMKIFMPLLDLEKSDSMMKTKESDSMLGYIASLLYTLGAKAYRVIISLLVFCLRGIILLVIICVLAKLIDCFAK